MKKVDIIETCEVCSNVWWYLGTTPCCILMDRKPCWDGLPEDQEIPDWCPLPTANEEPVQQHTTGTLQNGTGAANVVVNKPRREL